MQIALASHIEGKPFLHSVLVLLPLFISTMHYQERKDSATLILLCNGLYDDKDVYGKDCGCPDDCNHELGTRSALLNLHILGPREPRQKASGESLHDGESKQTG